MTAKRRAPIEGLATGERTLDAEAARYLARVLRLEAGDAFVAFDPKTAKEADARIVSIDHGIVTVAVGEVRSARVVAPREATVIQGLAKGEKCDAIVRDATELGATRIVFAETARSVVKLEGDRARERLLRWEKIAAEAARQSLRGDAPVIALASWSEAVATANADAARFVLDPAATTPAGAPLLDAALDVERAVTIAVGPEGGLTDEELETAEKAGFQRVSLGPIVLRTETVTAAMLGALRVLSHL
ncbi:MAG TPA: 16S rRNA (uracil(1498)-N(3))-methyltransferase [Polyangiaceae bacterium]